MTSDIASLEHGNQGPVATRLITHPSELLPQDSVALPKRGISVVRLILALLFLAAVGMGMYLYVYPYVIGSV